MTILGSKVRHKPTNRIGIVRELLPDRKVRLEHLGQTDHGAGLRDSDSVVADGDLVLIEAKPAAAQKDEPAWKQDAGKARIDLIAPEFLFGTAAVLEFGAAKYAERNWEKGMSWGRCFGALMRHMWAWWGGEQKDAETGMSHLAHAACCLMFLMAYENRKIGTDDRSA